jgi:hypothetical protein
MATPVLNNGIALRDNVYEIGSNYDSYHLYNMMKDAKPTDLGPIEFWANTQVAQMPLYAFSNFGKGNTIDVDDPRGRYTWQTPVANDLPQITRDIDPADMKKGIAEKSFRIVLNRREYGHTAVLTFDKYRGLEFRVTEDPIVSMGNNEFVYTCKLINNNSSAYLDNKYLVPGTKVFRVTSGRGEYGERWDDVVSRAGYREFYNILGNAEANASYHISQKADAMMRNGQNTGGIPVTEIWKINDPSLRADPSLRTLEDISTRLGQVGMLKAMKEGQISKAFITEIERQAIKKVTGDLETYLMWGKGGRVQQDGPDDLRFSTGLWIQSDNGYKKVYNIGTFSTDMFNSEIYNYYIGKVNFEGPDPKRKLIVQTGLAGMQQMNKAIQQFAINSGLVQNAHELGAIKGEALDLDFGYAFTSYTIPFLANLKFVINPAFDNVEANEIENPIINGFRLSSYSYIIFDVTDRGTDNIKMLRDKYDHEFHWMYQNGTADYMGRTKGFQSSGDFNGYKVKMFQKQGALVVMDPTRLLKIVAKNPITGYSL